MSESIHVDLFNMFCGRLFGEGIHRKVFECKVRLDLVVKVESDDVIMFLNYDHVWMSPD